MPNVIDRGTARSQHVSDRGAHVACAEDRDIRQKKSLLSRVPDGDSMVRGLRTLTG